MKKRYVPILLILLMLFVVSACEDDSGEPESAASNPTADLAPRAEVMVSEALVFTHPSREAAVLFRLIEGDQVAVVGHTEADPLGVTWYQVGYGDQFGWIAGSQVEISGDISRTRLVELEPVATIELPPTIDLALLPTATATSNPNQVFAIVTVAEAIIRAQPRADAAEVQRLFVNERLEVIGRVEPDEQGNDYYLLARGSTLLGWVQASDLNLDGDIKFVPLVEDALAAALPTEAAQVLTPTATPEPDGTTEVMSTTELSATVSPPPTSTPRSPSRTPDVVSIAQAAPTATNFPEEATTEATEPPNEIRRGIPPPLSIELPEGWQQAHIFIPLNTASVQGELPMTMYRGPLEGNMNGMIWVIYGFPNIIQLTATEINLYGDAVQLLRSIIFDTEDCTLGLGTQPGEEPRTYSIGGLDAVGTIYSASPCTNMTEMAGFFAALQVEGVNFAFFAGVEPVQPAENVSSGLAQLQAILDTVEFELFIATEEPEAED